jgi:hypothetical protein
VIPGERPGDVTLVERDPVSVFITYSSLLYNAINCALYAVLCVLHVVSLRCTLVCTQTVSIMHSYFELTYIGK